MIIFIDSINGIVPSNGSLEHTPRDEEPKTPTLSKLEILYLIDFLIHRESAVKNKGYEDVDILNNQRFLSNIDLFHVGSYDLVAEVQ